MIEHPFRPEHFERVDESSDRLFYSFARKVVHLDDAAIEAVKEFFREMLPPQGVVLDLMSSWRSHWPEDLPKQRLVGLGLNGEEMADNPKLDDYVVHDVNEAPRLPFEEGLFDAVVLTVSIQYLIHPLEVFREVNRTLKAGGVFAVIFSNRMFPSKAVAIWRAMNDYQHAELVASFFRYAGNFEGIDFQDRTPASTEYTDPVYVVLARKASAAAHGAEEAASKG